MNKQKRNLFFEKISAYFPSPETELNFVNNYTLLVAVVLSAQSTDKGVNKATESLFSIVQTPKQMMMLGEEKLANYIRTIGLYKTKSKNIIKLSSILIERYNSVVPATRESLMELPGVGRKTANVVLNVAFGQPTMPVDTHVFRVSNRTGMAKGKTPEEVEEKLLKAIPKKFAKDAHHLLILLGRYVCIARSPKCKSCPVKEECAFKDKTV